jgi:hypothetical protein
MNTQTRRIVAGALWLTSLGLCIVAFIVGCWLTYSLAARFKDDTLFLALVPLVSVGLILTVAWAIDVAATRISRVPEDSK